MATFGNATTFVTIHNYSVCPGPVNGTNTSHDLIVVGVWSCLLTYGLLMNLITLSGIIRNQQMRQSTSYWLIISLAACDIFMILISLSHLLPATLWHNDFLCTHEYRNIFALFLYDVFWYSGVIQLGGMAVNRFVSIVYPIRYRRMFSRQNTVILLACLWMLAVAASLPALFPCCYTIYDHHIYVTYFVWEESPYYILDLCLNTISLCVMVLCYAAILYRVRQSQLATKRHRTNGDVTSVALNRTNSRRVGQQPRPSSREMKLFVQFFVVSVVFLLTFLTWQWLYRLPDPSRWVGFTTTTFFFINNAINPTVYLIYNSGLRREVRSMYCWWYNSKQPPHQQQTPSSDNANRDDSQIGAAATTTLPAESRVDSERTALASSAAE